MGLTAPYCTPAYVVKKKGKKKTNFSEKVPLNAKTRSFFQLQDNWNTPRIFLYDNSEIYIDILKHV